MGADFEQTSFPHQESFASTHISATPNAMSQIPQRDSQLTYEIDVEHQTSTIGYQAPAQYLWEELSYALDPVYSHLQEPPDTLSNSTPSFVFANNQVCEEYFIWEDHGTLYTFVGDLFIDQGSPVSTRPLTNGYRRP